MKAKILTAGVVALIFIVTPFAQSAQLNFTPFLTVSEEYNDNIFLTNDDEEDDFITRTTIGGTLELLGRTSGLELTYRPFYEWFDEFDENDGWSQDLSGRLWHDFTANTTMSLRNAYVRTRESLVGRDFVAATSDDPLVAPEIDPDQLRQGREEYYRNATTLRLDHRFGAEDKVYASYRYNIRREVDNPPPGEDTNEYDIWTPALGLTYWFTNFWGIDADFFYENSDYKDDNDQEQWNGRLRLNRRITRHLDIYAQYEQTIVSFDEETDGDVDYDVYRPTAGFNYQLDQNTRIDLGAGWYYQDFDDGDNKDGFFLEASADKVWPYRRGLIGLTLLSGTDVDNKGDENRGFRIYYDGSVRGDYAFTPRFSGNARVGYRWSDYPDDDPGRTDKTILAAAGLRYQALRWMFLNLDYTFRDLSTDDKEDEYTQNRVIFSVTLRPERPFQFFR
jgi:hypothetical protein